MILHVSRSRIIHKTTLKNDDAFDSYDELLIIFGGFEETITTDTIVDKPRRGRRRHRGSNGKNSKKALEAH